MTRAIRVTPDGPDNLDLDNWDVYASLDDKKVVICPGELEDGIPKRWIPKRWQLLKNEGSRTPVTDIHVYVPGPQYIVVTRPRDHATKVKVYRRRHLWRPKRLVYYSCRRVPCDRLVPRQLTEVAVLIAGRQRAEVGCEWASHLAEVSDGRQVREAAGFVHAAISYRLQDLVDLLWIPADVVLASRELSTLAVLLATLTAAVISIHGGGLYGLVNNLANIAVVWAGSYGLIRVGRWWRGVKPPKHKPRRENE